MKKINVKGLIVPLDWDNETYEIVTIGLETRNDVTYIINGKDITSELEVYVNNLMTLSGKVWENEFGELFIDVTAYEVASKKKKWDSYYASEYNPYHLRMGIFDINEEFSSDDIYW